MKKGKGRGKAKGSEYERSVARELSKWYYGEEGYLWRRPGSGWIKSIPGQHSGDIVPVGDRVLPRPFPFHVEVKRYARHCLQIPELLISPEKSFIYKTWEKAVKLKHPALEVLLFLKEDRRDPIVFMEEWCYGQIVCGSSLRMSYNGCIVQGVPWRILMENCDGVRIKKNV